MNKQDLTNSTVINHQRPLGETLMVREMRDADGGEYVPYADSHIYYFYSYLSFKVGLKLGK